MNWLIRIFRAFLYGLIGAACGGLAAWVIMALWTAVFSRVPLKYSWRYIQEDPGRAVFAMGVVALGFLLGLVGGAVKGLRET